MAENKIKHVRPTWKPECPLDPTVDSRTSRKRHVKYMLNEPPAIPSIENHDSNEESDRKGKEAGINSGNLAQ